MSGPFSYNNRRTPSSMDTPNDGMEEEIISEEPTMRAVALMGPPSIGLHDSFGARPTPSFGGAPLSFSSRPGPGLKRDLRQSKGTKGKELLSQEWSGKVVVPETWKVDNLEQLPEDFALERTSREVVADGTEVAQRISDALRMLSIEADYNTDKAKAKCMTEDYVSFRIRLFAATEEGTPVIVEVQRRDGSFGSFMRSCRAILDAAEGKPTEAPKKRGPPAFKKPIGQMKCLQEPMQAKKEDDSKLAVDKAVSLLKGEELDNQVLGMEALLILTDDTKTASKTALYASQSLCLDAFLKEKVTEVLEKNIIPGDEEGPAAHLETKMHHLVLRLLSNALTLTAKDGCLKIPLSNDTWFPEVVIPSLLLLVRDAKLSPNDARAACCSLKAMMTCSNEAIRCVDQLGGSNAFAEARSIGEAKSEQLSIEAKACLSIIHELAR